ncbi:Rne/Rng family ribonuclease [Bacillus sp. FJAT-49736]|uniref:Rne/Rng family ribonuclease n=1 Tax=Bacillus sp. FJAT-49736 TaxID=2833582 RepID=UPI001BC94246|nr:Rne/Rng family ribonuclease [Bacillus sp. FJAT-49736]MBS4173693.1 Rne/Rng family ribonuclease [Bacillus sp. FJAT-49736]
MNQIIMDYKYREKRFGVIENNIVTKISIQQPTDQSKVGNIYLGKVVDVKVGMNAAFVDIGVGKNGYLHRDQLPLYIQNPNLNKEAMPISKFIQEGQKIIVQVKKDETDLKGPLLTAIIELSGERMVYLPEGDYIAVSKKADKAAREKWQEIAYANKKVHEGFIIRTEAVSGNEKEWAQELQQLRSQYSEIIHLAKNHKHPTILWEKPIFFEEVLHEMVRLKEGKVVVNDSTAIKVLQEKTLNIDGLKWEFSLYQEDQNIFSAFNVEGDIENGLKRIVWLSNGSYIVIDETEALVIVDVNTGKYTGRENLQDTVLKTNILAAKEIGRQLSIRNYGGIILVDFIDMKKGAHQQQVVDVLTKELSKDTRYSRIVGFTELGILQITRKKTKKSLPETVMSTCPVCSGKGKIYSAETMAFRLERELWEKPFKDHEAVLVELTENVKNIFCGEQNVHLVRLEQHLHIKIIFKVIWNSSPVYFIRQFGTKEDILSGR